MSRQATPAPQTTHPRVRAAANRELITRFEQKIQATLARIWGEETGDTPK